MTTPTATLQFNRPPDQVVITGYRRPMPTDIETFDLQDLIERPNQLVVVGVWEGKTKITRLGIEVRDLDEAKTVGHRLTSTFKMVTVGTGTVVVTPKAT